MRPLVLLAALTVAAPAFATETPQPAPPPAQKMICRAQTETGSLVKKRKTCMTREQWQVANQANEDGARKMLDDNQSRPEGNPGGP